MIYLTLDSWGRFSCPTAGLLGLLSLSRPEKVLKTIQSISIIVCTFKKSIYDEAISNSNTKEIKPTHIKTFFRCVNIS